jgi:hypothetical protein
MSEDSKDLLIELFTKASGDLAARLAEMHANMKILLDLLEDTELTPVQQSMVNVARKRLTKNQDAFLKEYGEWNKPGQN